jgi:hypothetical protein
MYAHLSDGEEDQIKWAEFFRQFTFRLFTAVFTEALDEKFKLLSLENSKA